jgi:hypothetical protein
MNASVITIGIMVSEHSSDDNISEFEFPHIKI